MLPQNEGVLIAHLSDLHLRDDSADRAAFQRQIDRISARTPDHLAITGDLLDRWSPRLLDWMLSALDAGGWLHADRTTILHGNHDFASSGGHPRTRADLWRLALRFWDPPPLVAYRRRAFYRTIERRAPGLAGAAPFIKNNGGYRIAVLDTVPVPWLPLTYHPSRSAVRLRHAIGCVSRHQAAWLSRQQDATPLIVLVHHYPSAPAEFTWKSRRLHVEVPMEIPAADRDAFWSAAQTAGAALVVCGHLHRARLEHVNGIALGLNGQSGADWAGRTIAYYRLDAGTVTATYESV
jgi:UDP-2,3-diacylglucosamine pyrophosphatase LpxH